MLEASDTGDWSLSTAVTALDGRGVVSPAQHQIWASSGHVGLSHDAWWT